MNSSREDYILAIYRLGDVRGFTSNKQISEYFEISKASVSEMIKKLMADGMVEMSLNKIKLTAQGIQEAEKLLSTHRIWEYFLTTVLKMPKDKVHEQADLLEHVTGEELKHALNKYLEYPLKCPHGQDIFLNSKEKE